MPKYVRSTIGGKKKETRNQKRKREYAELAKAMRADGSRRSLKRKSIKAAKAAKIVGNRGYHVNPCGNVACKKCYVEFHHKLWLNEVRRIASLVK